MNMIVKQMHNVVMIKVENLPENMEELYGEFRQHESIKNQEHFLRCVPQPQHEMGKDYLNIGYEDSGNYCAHAFNSVGRANDYITAISNLFVLLKEKEEKLKRAEQMMRDTMRPDWPEKYKGDMSNVKD